MIPGIINNAGGVIHRYVMQIPILCYSIPLTYLHPPISLMRIHHEAPTLKLFSRDGGRLTFFSCQSQQQYLKNSNTSKILCYMHGQTKFEM
uniref:Uncharacterized protein n=1 Tax=Arundo donax TaxID=35708 RepID=A0A0A9DX75_ARUDO